MIFIPLEELSAKNKKDVLLFVVKYEKKAVALASLVKKHSKGIFAVYANEVDAKNLYGILSLNLTLFFLLPFVNVQRASALQKDFISSFEKFFFEEKFNFPECISGEENGVSIFVNIFEKNGKKIEQLNYYDFMILDKVQFFLLCKEKFKKNQHENLKVLRCSTNLEKKDWHSVLELQRTYEKEEVVPKNFEFNEVLCNLKFLKSVKKQYILVLKVDDKIVSKAGTNAIGFSHVQLGGVFTEKSCRNKGYSSYLLTVLLSKLLKTSHIPVLFVKKENFAAQKLYESLGFKKDGSWLIAYLSV